MALTPTDEKIFEEQRSIRRRNRVRTLTLVSIVVLGLGLMVHVAHTWFALPWTLHRLQGEHLETVERELGPPLHRWGRDDFQCLPSHPCMRKTPPEGPVLFYWRGFIGYYLYFDAAGVLTEVEPNSS